MKNTLLDLNNYLFEAIERLNDDGLSNEELEKEIKRADAVKNIATTVIANADICFKIKKHADEYGTGANVSLPMITGATNEKG